MKIESMQFLLKEERNEGEVLALLKEALGFSIDLLTCEEIKSTAFAQISTHDHGYKQSFLISWPLELTPYSSLNNTISFLSNQLKVDILCELDEQDNNRNDIWLLAKPDGSMKKTLIKYIDDGIDEG